MILMFLYKIIIKLFVGKTIWSNQFGVKYDFNEIDPQNKIKQSLNNAPSQTANW